MNTDKHYLMDLKKKKKKTDNQRQVFYRYLQIAEHYIFTENEKEGSKILRRLGFNQKIIKSFIKSINNCYEDDEEQIMKEIMMGKVPKRLLN